MLKSVAEFLRYFDAVHRRAVRDVAALPPEADGWAPAVGSGEKAWSINSLIGHIAGSRLYFASAYCGDGWISPQPPDVSRRDGWLPALEESAARFRERIGPTPDAWLERKVEMIRHREQPLGLADPHDDAGARYPSSQPNRHICRHQRLGRARYLRPQL